MLEIIPSTVFRGVRHKKSIVTLSIIMLVCSLLTYIFVNGSMGASLTEAIHVKNENELKKAINTASKTTTITLDNDITLTDILWISAERHHAYKQ